MPLRCFIGAIPILFFESRSSEIFQGVIIETYRIYIQLTHCF